MSQTSLIFASRRAFLRNSGTAVLSGAAVVLVAGRETLAQTSNASQANSHNGDSHLSAATRYIEVDGDKFAYRRWG